MIELLPSRAIALALGPLQIHWYGLMYALGFLLGIAMLPRLLRLVGLSLTAKDREHLFLSVFLGVLLGGRLGFVLFYGGTPYLEHPLQIFAVWRGGMSSHGGFVAVILALILFARYKRIELLRLTDAITIPVAIGLALGRLGNLMNGELYGTLTSVPWGMHFPDAEGLRHPTQIYAMLKDLLTLALCFSYLQLVPVEHRVPGRVSAIFLMTYGVLRFIVEMFREQPYGYSEFFGASLSRGQVLTIPIILLGVALFMYTCFSRSRDVASR